MITGELRNKIDRLWETFWTGGITNPLDVVEQMTYLMFIHDLDETDNLRSKESAMLGLPYTSMFGGQVQIGDRTVAGDQLKWSQFHDFPAVQMYTVVQELVFPFIKTLHSDKDSAYAKYMGDAIFKIPTPLMLEKICLLYTSTPSCFMQRNRYMARASQRVIAVYDGRDRGGTLFTLRYAHTLGREIRVIRI